MSKQVINIHKLTSNNESHIIKDIRLNKIITSYTHTFNT